MTNLVTIFIFLIPWGNFFFKQADIWHAQGQFFQVGLLVLFCWSFFEKPRFVHSVNRPLGAFILWAGLVTSCLWITQFTKTQHYPIKIFLPFFNLLCFVLFYKICLEYLDKDSIDKIFKWFRYSIIALLFYCVLQYLQLDQFFKGLGDHQDELVGTIGNPSHLAGYLALVSPLFFNKKGVLPLILLWIIILLTDSATGLLTGFSVTLFWLFMQKKTKLLAYGLCSGIVGLCVILAKLPEFFTSSHRLELWSLSYQTFKQKAITGFGLGSFGLIKFDLQTPSSVWRHAHSEPYQVAFELGIIGLFLAIWCIYGYFNTFRAFKTNQTITLESMFFGFCILSLFFFPAHLWIMATLGMISYSFMFVNYRKGAE